jgi:hypothetical protein
MDIKIKYLLHGHFDSKISNIIDKARKIAYKKFNKYSSELDFTYGKPHVTIIYGPVFNDPKYILEKFNRKVIDKYFYPGFIDKFKNKLPDDLKYTGISIFINLDRIIIKAEFESKKLNEMKNYLINCNQLIKSYYVEFKRNRKEFEKLYELELLKRFPKLYSKDRSYNKNSKGWIHATLLVIKPNINENEIIKIIETLENYLSNQGLKIGDIINISEIGINLKDNFIKFW